MEPHPLAVWLRRAAVILVAVVTAAWAIGVWIVSSMVERDWLTPRDEEPEYNVEVATVGNGSIVLSRTPLTEREGVWGLASADAYGQVSAIIERREDVVERAFRPLEGELRPGERVRFDQYAFAGDPLRAHGIAFEEVRVAGDLGAYPAWMIEGDRDTWVILVHGLGVAERRQALRVIPSLWEAGFSMLVVTFRNDEGAPAAPDGRYAWGRSEWRDIAAAARFAQLQGAEELVVYGFDMGAEVAATFLHESELVADTVGLVLDSPVLDLEAAVDQSMTDRGVPGLVLGGGKTVTTLRFDVDWRRLDQVERAAEFDVPVLLMHGSADQRVPVASSDAFAAARPDLVRYERFEGADHLFLWNENPVRYETAVTEFLNRVAAPSAERTAAPTGG